DSELICQIRHATAVKPGCRVSTTAKMTTRRQHTIEGWRYRVVWRQLSGTGHRQKHCPESQLSVVVRPRAGSPELRALQVPLDARQIENGPIGTHDAGIEELDAVFSQQFRERRRSETVTHAVVGRVEIGRLECASLRQVVEQLMRVPKEEHVGV